MVKSPGVENSIFQSYVQFIQLWKKEPYFRSFSNVSGTTIGQLLHGIIVLRGVL